MSIRKITFELTTEEFDIINPLASQLNLTVGEYILKMANDHAGCDVSKRISDNDVSERDILEALILLYQAYGEAHAFYDLGECEGSILAHEIINKLGGIQ